MSFKNLLKVSIVPVIVIGLLVLTRNALAAPSLIISKTVSVTTAAPGDSITYVINFRCASVTEDCPNATITDNVPSVLNIVSVSAPTGFVVTRSGSPANNLSITKTNMTAGATGQIVIKTLVPLCDATGTNYDNSASFSATGASAVTANVSGTSINPAIPSCSSPPGTGGDLRKITTSVIANPGGKAYWVMLLPAQPASYVATDNLEPIAKNIIHVGFPSGITVEFYCAGAWRSVSSTSDWAIDTSPLPTGCTTSPIPPGSNTGLPTKYVDNVTAIRYNVPIGASLIYHQVGSYIPLNTPNGYQVHNCIEATGGYTAVDCAPTMTIATDTIPLSNWVGKKTLGLNGPVAGDADDINTEGFYTPYTLQPGQAVADNQELYTLATSSGILSENDTIVNPVFTDLIDPAYMSFTANDWWAIKTSPYNPNCESAVFTQTPNYNGTGKTLLKWVTSNCSITFNGIWGYNPIQIYFTNTINPGIPSGTNVVDNMSIFGEGDKNITTTEYDKFDTNDLDGDGNTSEHVANTSASFTVPVINYVESEKLVKGDYDTIYGKFPTSGYTDIATGRGQYEMYIRNDGNTNLTKLHILDILPNLDMAGTDDSVIPGMSRGSEWNMDFVSLDSVELYDSNTTNLSPVAPSDYIVGFSTAANPCRQKSDSLPVADQIQLDGGVFPTVTNVTNPAGCTPPSWNSTASDAESFGMLYTPSSPIEPGDYIKIKFTADFEGALPPSPNGLIAWNSFAYTATSSDDGSGSSGDLLSSEPVKTGIQLVDKSITSGLGDYVFFDNNSNGVQDAGDTPVQGVRITLYDSSNNLVNTTLTDNNGFYQFLGLDPSTAYTVKIEYAADFSTGPLSGYVPTATNAGVDDTIDSDAILSGGYPTITNATTGLANTFVPTYDFGFVRPASIGNYVWYEGAGILKNGYQDPEELPASGVSVWLVNPSTGSTIATTTTDASGHYLFDNLPSGDYIVRVLAPGGYMFTTKNSTGNSATDSDADSSGYMTQTHLDPGEADMTWDAGLTALPATPVSVGNFVWIDYQNASTVSTNGNGLFDSGELPLSNVVVELYDDLGFPVTSTVTDANGYYSFINLTPSTQYKIRFIAPNGWTYTIPNVGADVSDSDADVTTGETIMFTTPATGTNGAPSSSNTIGPDDSSWDAGFLPPMMSLGDVVWFDTNNNAIKDGSETTVFANVIINLYTDADGDGLPDQAAGSPFATTTTNGSGMYSFSNLAPYRYIVSVAASNFASGGVLENWNSSSDIFSSLADNNTNNDDNGLDSSSVIAPGYGTISSPVILNYNDEPDNDGDTDENSNLSIDFGFYRELSIDLTIDKQTTSTGPYYRNATVQYALTVTNNGIDATTDASLIVKDLLPSGLTFVSATGINWSCNHILQEITCTRSSGASNLGTGQSTENITVVATVDTITNPGSYTNVSQANPGLNEVITESNTIGSTNSGYETGDPSMGSNNDDSATITVEPVPTFAIGNRLWIDFTAVGAPTNNNAMYDLGEAPIVGATIELLDGTGNPVDDPNQASFQAYSLTTDSNGYYRFEGLVLGDYKVRVAATNFQPSGVLEHYLTSQSTSTTYTVIDNNHDHGPDSYNLPINGVSSSVVTLANLSPLNDTDAGAIGAASNGITPDNQTNLTVDFGFIPAGRIGDFLWIDANKNGLQDNGETPVAGATIELLDELGNPIPGYAKQVTNSFGQYGFDVYPGSYKIKITNLPVGYTFTSSSTNLDTNDTSKATSDGLTLAVSIAIGQTYAGLDAGIVLSSTSQPNNNALTNSGQTFINLVVAGTMVVIATLSTVILSRKRS